MTDPHPDSWTSMSGVEMYAILLIDGPNRGVMCLFPGGGEPPASWAFDPRFGYTRVDATPERISEEFRKAGYSWPVPNVNLYSILPCGPVTDEAKRLAMPAIASSGEQEPTIIEPRITRAKVKGGRVVGSIGNHIEVEGSEEVTD